MSEVQKGTTVKLNYQCRLKDGTVVEQTREDTPAEIKIGENKIIPVLEENLMGMDKGDKKTIELNPSDAFGEYQDEKVINIHRDQIPEDIEPKVGQELNLKMNDGNNIRVLVTEMDDSSITLDGNHPLAGKDVIFDVEVVDVA